LHHALSRFLNEPQAIAAYGEASREKARELTPACGAARWVETIESVLS
jgi:hypothetical protein